MVFCQEMNLFFLEALHFSTISLASMPNTNFMLKIKISEYFYDLFYLDQHDYNLSPGIAKHNYTGFQVHCKLNPIKKHVKNS